MGESGKRQLGKQENEEEEEIKRLLLGIMEGYNDTVVPPLSYFSSNFPAIVNTAETGSSSRKKQKNKASWVESLIRERRRREQMSEKYSVLQSMIPTLSNTSKLPKEKIIGNAVNYIKYLEEEKDMLEALLKFQVEEPKAAKHFLSKCTNPNSSVEVSVSDGVTFLEIQLPFRRGSVVEILKVLEKHKADVLEARISINDRRTLTFTATIMLGKDGGILIDKIREEILNL